MFIALAFVPRKKDPACVCCMKRQICTGAGVELAVCGIDGDQELAVIIGDLSAGTPLKRIQLETIV